MIKRTLCFSSPGDLRLHLRQLVWRGEDGKAASIPIEDIGVLILESPLVTVSTALLQALTESCAAVVLCDRAHLPAGYLLPQTSHTLASRTLRAQIALTDAACARLWRQLVVAKIENQAHAIASRSAECANHLLSLARRVRNGDPENLEAQAARVYFAHFSGEMPFRRERFGERPNAALNYGYAILRAAVARSLVASGLLPALGLHHRNQYNHFCLADDVMEPYRPFVDLAVLDDLPLYAEQTDAETLSPEGKRALLSFLTADVGIGGVVRPLFNAVQLTTASLARCVAGEEKALALPAILQECQAK